MKKVVVLGMALCTALAFSSCKSSESAYKKAYEKAKQMELAEAQNAAETPAEAPAVEAAPVVETTPQPAVTTAPVREEKVELVSGDGLKAYSVVCGSFGIKANADCSFTPEGRLKVRGSLMGFGMSVYWDKLE